MGAGGNTVTTPTGQPPVKNPDGGSTLPGGGTVATADGARIAVPAGATIDKDGNVAIPADKEAKGALAEGVSATFPGGSVIDARGLITVGAGLPGGGAAQAEVALSGGAAIAAPAGSVIGDGAIRLPLSGPAGKITYAGADGTVSEIEIRPGYAVEIQRPDLPGASGLEIFFNSPAIRLTVGDTEYQAKGETKEAQSPAFIDNDRTYLGIRDIGNALGGEIAWDRASGTASLSKNGVTALATVGQGYIRVVGKDGIERREPIDAPALNRAGRVYLPGRAILEAFGYSVAWDGASRSVSATR
ncbi:MAG: copper amine oxidase N-terminal domain-containing protein [Peptococcaceae bacterium]|nr:copper amine oxidase N-terminal domain-containing protein [Peptococcaceae bacterium]